MKSKKQYGHVGIVTGAKMLKSPCHNVIPTEMKLPQDEDGFTPVEYICSKCKRKYDAIELTIF